MSKMCLRYVMNYILTITNKYNHKQLFKRLYSFFFPSNPFSVKVK